MPGGSCLLVLELVVRLGVDVGEDAFRWRLSASRCSAPGSGRPTRRPRPATVLEEVLIGQTLPGQVRLDPLDRVQQLPVFFLGRHPIAGRVVGRGVRIHPVGEGLDHHRAVAGAALLQCPPGHRQAGQHIVAVDPDARESRSRSTSPRAAPATAWPPARRSPTGCSGSRRRSAHRRRRRTPFPRARRPGWSRRRRRRRWWPHPRSPRPPDPAPCRSRRRTAGPSRTRWH